MNPPTHPDTLERYFGNPYDTLFEGVFEQKRGNPRLDRLTLESSPTSRPPQPTSLPSLTTAVTSDHEKTRFGAAKKAAPLLCSVFLLFSCLYRGPHQSRNDLFIIVFMNNKALSSQKKKKRTLPLARVGRPNQFFKVGIVSLQIGLQIGRIWRLD